MNSQLPSRTRPTNQVIISGLVVIGLLCPLATSEIQAQGEWLQQAADIATSPYSRNSSAVKNAFRSVVEESRRATVNVLGNRKRIALGTIVDERGFVLTKASELSGDVECETFDGKRYPAEVVGIYKQLDLAMLKVNVPKKMTAVTLSDEDVPAVGSLIATVGLKETPASVGVVSAPPRKIATPKGILGVMLDHTEKEGALVGRVLTSSAAAKAGVKQHDLITHVNGVRVKSREQLVNRISGYQPGNKVRLGLIREGKSMEVVAVLGRAFDASHGKRIEFQQKLGGPLSDRRAGFESALQHDSVLKPEDCGGPIVDLDGNVVGINIARASRVASYAVPIGIVRPLIGRLSSGQLAPGPSLEERQKRLLERLASINKAIMDFNKRLAVHQVALDESKNAEQTLRDMLKKANKDAEARAELRRVLGEKQKVEEAIRRLQTQLKAAQQRLKEAEIEKVNLENERSS